MKFEVVIPLFTYAGANNNVVTWKKRITIDAATAHDALLKAKKIGLIAPIIAPVGAGL